MTRGLTVFGADLWRSFIFGTQARKKFHRVQIVLKISREFEPHRQLWMGGHNSKGFRAKFHHNFFPCPVLLREKCRPDLPKIRFEIDVLIGDCNAVQAPSEVYLAMLNGAELSYEKDTHV